MSSEISILLKAVSGRYSETDLLAEADAMHATRPDVLCPDCGGLGLSGVAILDEEAEIYEYASVECATCGGMGRIPKSIDRDGFGIPPGPPVPFGDQR